jgi:hypothetical protein
MAAAGLASRLALAYPGRSIDEGHIASWAEALDGAGLDIADDIVSLLRLRCSDPPSVAQLVETAREVRRETMSPPLTLKAPRGPFLSGDDIAHGKYHLHRYWDTEVGDKTELERAKVPRACDCGWKPGSAA